MKELVLFGDSLFGRASKHIQLMFEAALPGYDVYNCATGGWDSRDCVTKAPFISKLEPDVMVLSLGTNDASPWKQVPIYEFKQNLPKIFDCFPNSKNIYFLPTPVDEAKATREGKELTIEHIRPYHEAAKEYCRANNIEFIDSFAIFMPLLGSGKAYHTEDGVHFNDFAYEVISKELTRILNP